MKSNPVLIRKCMVNGNINFLARTLKLTRAEFAQACFCLKEIFANEKSTEMFWELLLKDLPTLAEVDKDD